MRNVSGEEQERKGRQAETENEVSCVPASNTPLIRVCNSKTEEIHNINCVLIKINFLRLLKRKERGRKRLRRRRKRKRKKKAEEEEEKEEEEG